MAHVAIIHADLDGNIASWNAGAEALFGYRAPEAIGRALDDLIVPEAYRAAHRQGFKEAVAAKATKNDLPFVLPILCKDGQARHFAGRLAFLRDAYDRGVGAMAIFVADDPPAGAAELFRL